MDKFEVGEVAVLNVPGHPLHNQDVTVLAIGKNVYIMNIAFGTSVMYPLAYQIDVPGFIDNKPVRVWAEPPQLRKKQPPSDDRKVVRWADVPFHKQITGKLNA